MHLRSQGCKHSAFTSRFVRARTNATACCGKMENFYVAHIRPLLWKDFRDASMKISGRRSLYPAVVDGVRAPSARHRLECFVKAKL
jgi:hypothetical protein